jgi:hypothetical protein
MYDLDETEAQNYGPYPPYQMWWDANWDSLFNAGDELIYDPGPGIWFWRIDLETVTVRLGEFDVVSTEATTWGALKRRYGQQAGQLPEKETSSH